MDGAYSANIATRGVPPTNEADHVRTVASETPEPSIAYRLHANELIATLRTDERQGLGDEEARARLARYGPNELAAHKACEGLECSP